MNIEIEWQQPIEITRQRKLLFDANSIPAEIEARPGVYFFSRVFGNIVEPFYIGQSTNIRKRLKENLQSAKIREAIRETEVVQSVRKGVRWFSYGYLLPSKGPRNTEAVLLLVERYLIRQALADGHGLINHRGTKFKTHNITFIGSSEERRVFGKSAEIPVE
ncbi:hypothetical protein [Bradyrhizobium sp. HKCCYLS20291]|uniref:hypothetical protein n=1 Tax=Bradyrhizobium sp. HKCCYLS20291 TaxID=3420766 RepID=UPI003EB9E566